MYDFSSGISHEVLSKKEKELFKKHLSLLGLDDRIWSIYDEFMHSGTKYSKPLIFKLFLKDKLVAATYLMACYDYCPTISDNPLVSSLVRGLKIPVYVWMRSSIGAEIFANPGFLNLDYDARMITTGFLEKIRKEFLQLFVLDLTSREGDYPGSLRFPYPDEGMVDLSGYNEVSDYISEHGNIKKKLRKYRNMEGRVDVMTGEMDAGLQGRIYDAVLTTGEKSVFTLPYQDAYPLMCKRSAAIASDQVVHFVCRSEDEFFGYHSFMEFDDHLRCLNGAFNRRLKSTYHAYENMIISVVDYAITRGMKKIYFGPVLNETKKRMMNEFSMTNIYFLSRSKTYLKAAASILRRTKIQSPDMLLFSGCAQ